MLSPKTQTNLANAKGYFEEHLCAGDYYAENGRVQGVWLGAGAARLGLEGRVTREAFLSLCDNRHPSSGKRLTQRQKTTRNDKAGGEAANRRVCFDFTMSPPKSVSIAALVADDSRIVTAHREAVTAAVAELEGFASARFRECGANRDRRTGNIVAALFEHETSRPLDPHLHTHCIVFNTTHDAEEGRWKALQNYDMLAAQKYVENVYYHELARALRGFGYTVVNLARGDFEITEVPAALRERFSKRHAQIDGQTKAFLAEHPEMQGANVKAIREHLAHKERDRKVRGISTEQLRGYWSGQLSDAERETLHPPTSTRDTPHHEQSTVEALDWAEAHLFERRSVVREHELWRHALARARGSDVTVGELKRETQDRGYLRAEQDKVSRRDVLAREWAIVETAREGIGRYTPLGRSCSFGANDLAPDQLRAFRQILGSTDFMTLFRGGAGTGKSFVLRRVQDALRSAGHITQAAAPQRQQVIDLDREGLHDVQTVAELIQHGALPEGAVVIVDEAGQIGGQQMLDLLRLLKEANGRVILSGDTRQHGPVEASDAVRAIERYSGLRPAQLDEIRRQDPARASKAEERERIAVYRKAVEAASAGDLVASLGHLEKLGAVMECGVGEQRERLTEAYVGLAAQGESAIVISQTRAEVREINEAVRERLRERGVLTGAETSVIALEQIDLTAAQKADARHYPAENCIVFNREFRGCARGAKGSLVGVTPTGIAVEVNGTIERVSRKFIDRLTVCRPVPLTVCSGEKLQLKANAVAASGEKLANGEIVTVDCVTQNGSIRLEDGRTLPASYRQFQRGYAVTSYGSQGKTVDHVLFADAAVRAATNAQQWYVTISRGRKSIQIYTTDRQQLRHAIARSGDRELALDLANIPSRCRRVRERVLRNVHRRHEFAWRLCRAAMRAWAATFLKPETQNLNETPPRKQQQSVSASVLAT